MTDLSGKTALVTGASRGIGRASALALGKAGAHVLVHYSRAASEADAVVDQIKRDGGRAHAITADLATAEGPQKLAFDVRRIVEDRLDVLVANAGVSKLALIEEMTIDVLLSRRLSIARDRDLAAAAAQRAATMESCNAT